MILQLLVVLCGFGAVVFAAGAGNNWRRWLSLGSGFLVAIAWSRTGRPLDPMWVGGIVAVAAIYQLVRPPRPLLMAASSGLLASVWGVILHEQGVPLAAAITIAVASPISSAWLAGQRSDFAPRALFEEALLMLLCLAVVVAMAPGVYEGWESAVALNVVPESNRRAVPTWVLLVNTAAVALGGLVSLWKRRQTC